MVRSSPEFFRTYTYDALGQLLTETRHDEGIKVTNEYNHLGNIRFRKVYDWTPTSETLVLQYTYNYAKDTDAGWNYLLTSIVTQDYINNVTTTETVDYDRIGNPTSYRGATLAFNGRQLTSYTKGSTSISYQYDASGLRASKTVNGNTTIYQYVGDKLYFEQRADGSKMYYFYDSYGNLTHLYYHVGETKTPYNVVTNSQGDVIAIYNWDGNQLVASYSYDAWGNCTITQDTTGIGAINPIRYRGYYFDSEIGMYYLQSRYYDPNTGRFINADGYITTGQGVLSYNMYAYCMNNPVMYSDPSGEASIDAVLGAVQEFLDNVLEIVLDYLLYKEDANCYAYAMKLGVDPRTGKPFTEKPQPGEFAGSGLTVRGYSGEPGKVKSNIEKKVLADAEVLGFTFKEVDSADHIPKQGNWVVALVYADGIDYHWYRRRNNGSWWHKQGTKDITNLDSSGNVITDPATCDRGIYDGFLGYYEVGPN